MLKEEIINGIKKTYSDSRFKLLQVDTRVVYGHEVYDSVDTPHYYVETTELDVDEENNEGENN